MENLHNGNENGEHICGENLHGNNLDPTSLAVPIKIHKKLMQVDPWSLKLIGELLTPIRVDACSLKLIGFHFLRLVGMLDLEV